MRLLKGYGHFACTSLWLKGIDVCIELDEELCNELLNDMDFHYNKVKCRKIEGLMPKLMGMVEKEMSTLR